MLVNRKDMRGPLPCNDWLDKCSKDYSLIFVISSGFSDIFIISAVALFLFWRSIIAKDRIIEHKSKEKKSLCPKNASEITVIDKTIRRTMQIVTISILFRSILAIWSTLAFLISALVASDMWSVVVIIVICLTLRSRGGRNGYRKQEKRTWPAPV